MSRAARAKLLVPSFLVVASALACGETEQRGSGAPTSGADPAGGTAGSGNPRRPTTGGTGGTQPEGGTLAGGTAGAPVGGVGGSVPLTGSNPPTPCPAEQPTLGAACSRGGATEFLGYGCSFASAECSNERVYCMPDGSGAWTWAGHCCLTTMVGQCGAGAEEGGDGSGGNAAGAAGGAEP